MHIKIFERFFTSGRRWRMLVYYYWNNKKPYKWSTIPWMIPNLQPFTWMSKERKCIKKKDRQACCNVIYETIYSSFFLLRFILHFVFPFAVYMHFISWCHVSVYVWSSLAVRKSWPKKYCIFLLQHIMYLFLSFFSVHWIARSFLQHKNVIRPTHSDYW